MYSLSVEQEKWRARWCVDTVRERATRIRLLLHREIFFSFKEMRGYSQTENDSRTSFLLLHREIYSTMPLSVSMHQNRSTHHNDNTSLCLHAPKRHASLCLDSRTSRLLLHRERYIRHLHREIFIFLLNRGVWKQSERKRLAYVTCVAPHRDISHVCCCTESGYIRHVWVRGYHQRESDSRTWLYVWERAPRVCHFSWIYAYICVRERVYLIRVRHFCWMNTFIYVSERECTLCALVIFLGYIHIYMCQRESVHYSRSSFFLGIYIYICVREKATRAHHFS